MRPIECVQPQLGLFRISTEKTCPNPAQAYEVYKAMHGWTVTIYKDSNMFIELPLEESNDHPEDADHEAQFIFPNLLGFGLWNLKQSRTCGTVSTKPLQALMLWRRTHTLAVQSPITMCQNMIVTIIFVWPAYLVGLYWKAMKTTVDFEPSCMSGSLWMACPLWCRQGPST